LRAAIARRAGHVAAITLLVAIGSGTLLSFQHLTGTGDLASTFYGRSSCKGRRADRDTCLCFGRPPQGRRRAERWWQGELAALIAVLLLAAVLVSLPPPA